MQLSKGPRREHPRNPLVRVRNLLPSNGHCLQSHYLATGLQATISFNIIQNNLLEMSHTFMLTHKFWSHLHIRVMSTIVLVFKSSPFHRGFDFGEQKSLVGTNQSNVGRRWLHSYFANNCCIDTAVWGPEFSCKRNQIPAFWNSGLIRTRQYFPLLFLIHRVYLEGSAHLLHLRSFRITWAAVK
jgi:hypothetical protein